MGHDNKNGRKHTNEWKLSKTILSEILDLGKKSRRKFLEQTKMKAQYIKINKA